MTVVVFRSVDGSGTLKMMSSFRRLLICLPLLVIPLSWGCRRSPALQATQIQSRTEVEQVKSDHSLPVLPTQSGLPLAPSGAHYPLFPADPDELAQLLVGIEIAIRNPDVPADAIPSLAHQQQVIYRELSHRSTLSNEVRSKLDERWRWVFDQHISARRSFLAMHRGPASSTVPAWRIQTPAASDWLLEAYRSASASTGIDWEVLAAVNLVETGMGRIDGISVANAQGPMQFLPTTWTEPGIGLDGDIRDPWDAIHAAARYLVRRGGLQDIRKGLWGYNNSDHYGRAVLYYADLLKRDPLAYRGLYHWQIHYASSVGDLWLHEGYNQQRPTDVRQYLQVNPHSRPAG